MTTTTMLMLLLLLLLLRPPLTHSLTHSLARSLLYVLQHTHQAHPTTGMCGAALLLAAMVLGTGAPAVALGGHVALYREAVEWLPPWHWPAACTEAYSLNTFSWDRQGALHWGFAAGGDGGGGGGGGDGSGGGGAGGTLGSLAAGGEAWRMGVVMQSGGCEHGLAMAAADAAALRAAAAAVRLASCEADTAQQRQCPAEVGEEAAAAGAAALKAQKRVADIKLGTRIWWRAAAAAAFAAQPSIAATAGATTSGAGGAAAAPPPPVRQPRVLLSLPWAGPFVTMSDLLDALCLGMILIGCYEAAKDLWQQHEAGEYQAIMAVGAAMAASGRRYNRVLAIGGFAWAVRDAHRRVHDFTLAYVQTAHEFVLAVRASDVPASAT